MLSDIEIAQQAEMQKIREVAAGLSIEEDDLEYYGHYNFGERLRTMKTES